MSSYVQHFNDRLDFIEFKQNILLLKNPQHKASIFIQLNLDEFIKVRNLVNNYSVHFYRGNFNSLSNFESELYDLLPSLKSYPDSSVLILKALLGSDLFEKPRII